MLHRAIRDAFTHSNAAELLLHRHTSSRSGSSGVIPVEVQVLSFALIDEFASVTSFRGVTGRCTPLLPLAEAEAACRAPDRSSLDLRRASSAHHPGGDLALS